MKKINVDDFRIYRNQAQRKFENSRCLFTEFASSDADADRQTDRRRWKPDTPPNSEIICGQNVSTKVVCGILLFFEKKAMLKNLKKSWVPFRSYLLNSTANPAQFECKWAGLAVLFSR